MQDGTDRQTWSDALPLSARCGKCNRQQQYTTEICVAAAHSFIILIVHTFPILRSTVTTGIHIQTSSA